MCQEKPAYEELEARLHESERALEAIKDGEIDALVGEKGVYYLRLKELKEALSQSRKQMEEAGFTLDALMECVPEGITIADYPNMRIVRVSNFGKELLGKSSEDLEGITLGEHMAKWDIYESDGYTKAKTEHLPLARAIQKCEIIKNEEWILKTADGRYIPVLCNASPVRNREGKIIGGVIAWKDISELKKTETKLRLMNETLAIQVAESTFDLEKRASQLVKLTSNLIQVEQRERHRIATILHDHLQQLMVAAKINQEVLIGRIDSRLKPVAENVLDLINRSIRESRSLTTELSPPVLHSDDLSASLEWLARWMRKNQGFDVKLQVEPGIVLDIKELNVMLFQSIRELLLNILKHSGVKSAVVAMKKKDGQLRIIVSDRGAGFDTETVWEKSVSCDHFGLLSIRERMLYLGGQLEVKSMPDEGSTISLVVPLDAKKTTEKLSMVLKEDVLGKTVSAPFETDKLRVLIVDDHEVVRQGLYSFLASESDIEIIGQATDGKEAVHLTREIVPDVILMDINMPNMDGLQATRIIHSEFPQIRIIGLSIHEGNGPATEMISAGASACRSKSDNMELLLSEIRNKVD